jgi:hypothetical protein
VRRPACPFDRRLVAVSVAAAAASLLAFGLVSAIIPNPVFGRAVPPEPFAIATWLTSAPLMGLIIGTYLAPARARVAEGFGAPSPVDTSVAVAERRTSVAGYVGGIAAFLAIGCPVCNKIALVLLGAAGALNVWAPLQPVLALASLALLAATLVWRLRLRARGGGCAVPARRATG